MRTFALRAIKASRPSLADRPDAVTARRRSAASTNTPPGRCNSEVSRRHLRIGPGFEPVADVELVTLIAMMFGWSAMQSQEDMQIKKRVENLHLLRVNLARVPEKTNRTLDDMCEWDSPYWCSLQPRCRGTTACEDSKQDRARVLDSGFANESVSRQCAFGDTRSRDGSAMKHWTLVR